ncbi:hypothetical protein CG716_18370 [Mycolicibacterium sphagni]|uniref:Uncharacterized protein n=1 Tax=Mycolicibacterium sphagni TaxID=1786 RepID=A0A255DDP1_9MYCO|nr:hypothetical protein CG716_18370 [Mycolicibacterium sphagni]
MWAIENATNALTRNCSWSTAATTRVAATSTVDTGDAASTRCRVDSVWFVTNCLLDGIDRSEARNPMVNVGRA